MRTLVETFVEENYELRRNVVSDKYEFREKMAVADGETPVEVPWRELHDPRSINTMALKCRRELDEEKSWAAAVREVVYSENTPEYDPIKAYFDALPEWDGQEHVEEHFKRVPGMTDQLLKWGHQWMRSMVAHWLGKDSRHGNEQVLLFISDQGNMKTTFFANLLPPALSSYFIDRVNFGNKNDKNMALTNTLLANFDELDQVKDCQQAEFKHMITMHKVYARPIYGRAQENRPRRASFTATTNKKRPLKDATGSRRFICVQIPDGAIIDVMTPIDHDQIYAQLYHELEVEKVRYWMTYEEQKELSQYNAKFLEANDLESMIKVCFRRPDAKEKVAMMCVRS
ncbi:MAG: VapE family protein [Bacteroidales bacterium]|nr:VapE family protein [Bacteroidales bacterium]